MFLARFSFSNQVVRKKIISNHAHHILMNSYDRLFELESNLVRIFVSSFIEFYKVLVYARQKIKSRTKLDKKENKSSLEPRAELKIDSTSTSIV